MQEYQNTGTGKYKCSYMSHTHPNTHVCTFSRMHTLAALRCLRLTWAWLGGLWRWKPCCFFRCFLTVQNVRASVAMIAKMLLTKMLGRAPCWHPRAPTTYQHHGVVARTDDAYTQKFSKKKLAYTLITTFSPPHFLTLVSFLAITAGSRLQNVIVSSTVRLESCRMGHIIFFETALAIPSCCTSDKTRVRRYGGSLVR